MIRFLIQTAILLGANAIGLIVAAVLLGGMTLSFTGFLIAVVIFTAAVALLQPFLVSTMQRNSAAAGALGGVALIATLLALIITALVSDGLSIDGLATWLAATVIVWAAALLAAFLLPFLGLKRFLEERRAPAAPDRAPPPAARS
jgi:putative membrane protein